MGLWLALGSDPVAKMLSMRVVRLETETGTETGTGSLAGRRRCRPSLEKWRMAHGGH